MQFKDFITLQRGFDLPKTEMREGPYPVVGSTSIIGHHSECKAKSPGVIMGRSGSLGTIQFIEEPFWPHNTSLWVRDFKGNDPRFVYYRLQGFNFARFNSGAGVPTLNRNHLDGLEVEVPPVSEQRRIAGILCAYDNLIKNNQRRIKILEEMARSLYREWFVHFRFPGHVKVKMVPSTLGPIPQGWEVKSLEELATVTMGLSPKGNTYNEEQNGTPLVNGPVEFGDRFTKRMKWTTEPTKVCKEGDLVVCVRGSTTGKYVKSDGVYCLGRGVCGISSNYQCFIELLFENELPTLLGQTSGSTFPSWTGPQLKSHRVLSPPTEVIARFDALVKPMSAAVLRHSRQNQNLRRTRDLLLPRLLSGYIEIQDADSQVGKGQH